jgi:cytochrome oxidase Cu insertion factor (SCO1/SenC/PrrC family)
VSGNTAVVNGGGIFTTNFGDTNLSNSTVTLNWASSGGGLFNQQEFATTVTSSIVANNEGNQDIGGSSFTSGGHNLIGNGQGASGFTNGVNSDLVGTAANPINPLLGELQDNGGPTLTHALLNGSPALNAGSNPNNLTYDQRGPVFNRVVGGATDIGAYEVQVINSNRSPDAVNDCAVTNEDTAVTIAVLSNDIDPDGDAISLTNFTQATNGIVTRNTNGTATQTDDKLIYTPNANFFGTDSFTYSISDGKGGTDTATVSITVNPVNDPPDAVNDSAVTNEDTAVTIAVLSNDIDPDGDAISLITFTQGSKGTVTLNNNGTATKTDDKLVYTPNTNFNGTDSFIYSISDGKGGTDTATVNITVNPINDPPDAVNDYASTQQNTPITIAVLSNDTDPDGDPVRLETFTQGTKGTVTLNNNGTVDKSDDKLVYTPNTNFLGTDSFTYSVSDGKGGTDIATVNLSVLSSVPKIRIEKATNALNPTNPTVEEDADTAPGRALPVGTPVIWTYQVFNEGSQPLTITQIKDNFGTPNNLNDDFTPASVLSGIYNVGDLNRNNLLEFNEVWRYTSQGVVSYQAVASSSSLNVGLGKAADFGLLVLKDGTVANFKPKDSKIVGDIGYSAGVEAKNNELKGTTTLTGTVYVDTTATYAANANFLSSGGVVRNTTGNGLLNQANTDALKASTQLVSLQSTQQFVNKIDSNLTINSTGEINVIKIDELELKSGKILTLDGRNGFNDYFVINVVDLNNSGKTQFKLDGGQIKLVDVTPDRVIFNFPIEAGTDIPNNGDIEFKGSSTAFGTFLAPAEKVKFDNGTLTGAVIAKEFEVKDSLLNLTKASFTQTGGSDNSSFTGLVTVTAQTSQGIVVSDTDSSSHYASENIIIGDNVTTAIANQFNIALLIDVSGSMAWAFNGTTNPPAGQSRLDYAKNAFKQFLDQKIFDTGIAAKSVVRIVPFASNFPADSSRTPQTFAAGNYASLTAFQTALNSKIDSLFANGYTQYEPPLRNTAQWFQGSEVIAPTQATNKIYFLSDGADNDGYNIGSDQDLTNLYDGDIPNLKIQAFGFGAGTNNFSPDELDKVELGNGLLPSGVPANWQTNNTADVAVIVNDNPSLLADQLEAVSTAPTTPDTITGTGLADIIFSDNLILDDNNKAIFDSLANGSAFLSNYVRNYLLPSGSNFDLAVFDLNQSIGQNDVISGGAGNDIIFAQGGDDLITGGLGNDTLVGGKGIDTFIYQSVNDGADTVVDFQNGIDLINIRALGVTSANFASRVAIAQISGDTQVSVDSNLLATLTGIASGIDKADFILA